MTLRKYFGIFFLEVNFSAFHNSQGQNGSSKVAKLESTSDAVKSSDGILNWQIVQAELLASEVCHNLCSLFQEEFLDPPVWRQNVYLFCTLFFLTAGLLFASCLLSAKAPLALRSMKVKKIGWRLSIVLKMSSFIKYCSLKENSINHDNSCVFMKYKYELLWRGWWIPIVIQPVALVWCMTPSANIEFCVSSFAQVQHD